jgi:hypothetical protein
MMTQAKAEKPSLFYQLTHSEWLKTVKDLTGTQIKVLYYIRSLDPFENCKQEYSVTQIALDLGLSKGAVSKALKKLEQVGEIDMELVQVKIQIRPSKNSDHNPPYPIDNTPWVNGTTSDYSTEEQKIQLITNCTEEVFPIGNAVSQEKPEFPIGNSDFLEETSVSHRKPGFPTGNNRQSEPLLGKAYRPSNIYIEYLDIKTLSEDERERFLEFAFSKASELPTPPTLPGKWIAANFEELKELFEKQESASGFTHCGGGNSTEVLLFENCDASIHEGQYHTLMSLGLAKFCENATSSAWYEWAIAKYPEKFVNVPE